MSKDPGTLGAHSPFVMVGPKGLAYVGLHTDEADCWQSALGWPSEQEIQHHKQRGFAVYPATLTWSASPPPHKAEGAEPQKGGV